MREIKFEKTKFGNFLSGKGFYIALALCVMAVGIAAWASYNAGIPPAAVRDSVPEPVTSLELQAPADNPVNFPIVDVPYSEPSRKKETSSKKAKATNAKAVSEPVAAKAAFAFPCDNIIQKDFSGSDLVYCETMRDWRVHDGVDFTASKGTQVKSVSAGTVISITEDDMWGWTVVVKHANGIVAYYCGLQKEISVKMNRKIDMGTVIGGVGETPCEISDAEHLHFKVEKDGKIINPLEILGKTVDAPALGSEASSTAD